MPIGRISRILRMIEDGDHDVFAFDVTRKRHPLGARAPTFLFADFAFAAQVDAGYAGVVHHRHFGRIALLVSEDFWSGGRLFELARNADAERDFFRVVEDDLLVLRGQRDDAIDDPHVFCDAEDDRLVLLHDLRAIGHDPIHRHAELRAALAAIHGLHCTVFDHAELTAPALIAPDP